MYKFLKNTSLFIIVFFLSYPFMIFLSGYSQVSKALKLNLIIKGSFGHMFTRMNEVKKLDRNVDILFLGSSHSFRGFDPRNFKDKKTFNLGSNLQTPIQTKVLLERYLDKINPKLVIYEVYPYTLSIDGVESSLDLIANDKNDFKSLKMAIELKNIKTFNTLMYAGIAEIFGVYKNFVEPIKRVRRGNQRYILGGFVEREISYYKYADETKKKLKFKEIQLKKFKDCLDLLKRKNIKTILVYAPITSRLYNSYTNNNYVDSTFNSYNLKYYNFNKLIELNDSLDFYDNNHLNQNGVNKFNQKLIETLKL